MRSNPRARTVAIATALALSLATQLAAAQGQRSGETSKPGRPSRDLSYVLLMRYVDPHAMVLGADTTSVPPLPGTNAPVRLRLDTWESFPAGSSELVFAFFDLDPKLLSSFGESARARAFSDAMDPERHDGVLGIVRPRVDDRLHHLQGPAGAAYLGIFKTRVLARPSEKVSGKDPAYIEIPGSGPGTATFAVRILRVFGLPSREGRPPPVPIWFPWPVPTRSELPKFDISRFTVTKQYTPMIDLTKPLRVTNEGCPTSKEPPVVLHGSDDPDGKFNVVITGDGFTSADLPTYDALAALAKDALLEAEPFQSLAGDINIHSVRATAPGHGIGNCSLGTDGCTYYGMRGRFDAQGSTETFVGTWYPSRVHASALPLIGMTEVDVFLVIANCDVCPGGGGAFPSLKIATVTACDTNETNTPSGNCSDGFQLEADGDAFKDIVVHEIAHVVAGLADEYIGCAEDDDPSAGYPNLARAAELPPSWESAFTVSGGGSPFVHEYGDATLACALHEPIVEDAGGNVILHPSDPGYEDAVGLFWGCQFITETDPPCGCPASYSSACGGDFYRPSPRCKMRRDDWDFDPVCEDSLRERILLSASP